MRIWSRWNLHSSLTEMQSDRATLKSNLASFYKIKHIHVICRNPASGINLEKCRHMFTQKPVRDCLQKVYSKLEAMSLRANGLTNYVNPYNGTLHSVIKEETIDSYNNLDESLCWMKEVRFQMLHSIWYHLQLTFGQRRFELHWSTYTRIFH